MTKKKAIQSAKENREKTGQTFHVIKIKRKFRWLNPATWFKTFIDVSASYIEKRDYENKIYYTIK